MLSVDNIKQLKKLFRPEDGSDSEDDGHDGGVGQLGWDVTWRILKRKFNVF